MNMKDVFEPLDRSSLYESVYSKISLALIDGVLKPDEKLRIRALAEQLGTSVTPVRDAILKLVQEGALEWRGPKDIRVPRMRASQFEEIRTIRLRIEGLAASLAAGKASAAQVEELRSILVEIESARNMDDHIAAIHLNRMFHGKIASIAGLPILEDMIQRMWLRMGPVIASIYASGGRAMIVHFYELLDAIAKRNAIDAETAMHNDINSAARVIRDSGLLAPD
ncbi:FCD domain-containing protein [Rhizobium leguminosarum bv. viciae]|nr:FCD domain-containing protein [Rhizobium leguminosarum bv. viciae]NKQ69791.1 GntR family transcriptional regulator [Rhizobium ruizarguesonis]NKQ77795.1 GntR family transcriptional regulator [Rhizobium ruizarguesonis]